MDKRIFLMLSVCMLIWYQLPMATGSEELDMNGDLKVAQFRPIHHRSKRKVLQFDNFPHRQWPLNIPYYIETSFFLGLTLAQKFVVRDILTSVFEANTCLTFEELVTLPTDDRQFMHFYKNFYPDECGSYIGKGNGTEPFGGQPIFLGRFCFNIRGHVIFTIAAALGMHGEARRPDRDDYVDIYLNNMIPSGREYLDTIKEMDSTTHNIHYDFGSVMHPDARAFLNPALKNNMYAFTMVPKDRRYLRSMGQASEFAFHDALVLNTAYCEEHKRMAAPSPLDCLNGGYQGPPDYRCKCRDGFSGDTCELIHPGSAGCTPSSGYMQATDSAQCVSSPDYDGLTEYSFGDSCTWILQAPRGKLINAWFDGDIRLSSLGIGYTPCMHWIEIKDEGRAAPQGPRYCNKVVDGGRVAEYEPPTENAPITSTGNEMMVIFKAPDYRTDSLNVSNIIGLHTGFRLCFTILDRPAPRPTAIESTGDKHDDNEGHHRLTVIGIIVAALLLLLLVFVIVLICCVYKRCKKRQTPPSTPQPDIRVAYVNPGYASQSTVDVFATMTELEVKKNPDDLDFSNVGTPGGPNQSFPVAPPAYEEVPKNINNDMAPLYT